MFARLAPYGVIPVLALENPDQGLHVCEALLEGGLPVAEITFRTTAAADVIRAVSRQFPALTVGAGTVLTAADLQRAMDAGARFAVAPGCNPTVVRAAVEAGFPFAPGVCTPSDIERALELGVRNLKFFPAEAAGGVKMLKALAAPYAHLKPSFCPTGGLSPENMAADLAIPQVPVVGGTWLGPKDALAKGDWKRIAALAAEAVAIAARTRAG